MPPVDKNDVLPKIKPKNNVLQVSTKSAMDLKTELEIMRKRVNQMKETGTTIRKDKKVEKEQEKIPVKKRPENDIYERSKNALKAKSKLYKKIKRGEIEDEGEVILAQEGHSDSNSDSDSDSDNNSENNSDNSNSESDTDNLIEITDSYGRTRLVPQTKAYKYEQSLDYESDDDAPKVSRPSNLQYGDTIQYQAFQLDEAAVEEVYIRDKKSDDVHYDADWERRDRGAGFYKFSKDEEQRKKEMESLQNMNKEITEESEQIVKAREKRKDDFASRLAEIKTLREVNLKRTAQ